MTFTIQLHVVNDGACAFCKRAIGVKPVMRERWPSDVGPTLLVVELYHPSCAPAPKVYS